MATINKLNLATWKKLSDEPSKSCVRSVNKKFHLAFPPFYVNDVKRSVITAIERRRNHYEPDLGGVLAGFRNITIMGPKAEIMFNLAEIHVDVQGEFFIFNPSVGSMLTGIVNKKSVGHIGCLVHGLFNISLPKPFSLPAQSWQGSQANLNDEVVFTITRVDFQSRIPYIEGTIGEVRAHTSNATVARERTCSDSGVSIGSDDAVSTKKTIKAGKKLSLSKNADISNKTLAIDDEENKPTSPIRNKRKHNENLTPSAIETATEETPRKKSKKSEPSEDQDDDGDMMNLVSNLFADVTKKVMTRGPTDKKKSKKIENVSADSSVQLSGRKKSNEEELGNAKIKTEAQSDEDIIKELMFSVQKTTPRAVSSGKTSKKKLSMSQIVENNGTSSPAMTPQPSQKEPIAVPKPVNDSSAKKKKKSESGFDSESMSSASSSSSRQKSKKKSDEDIIKELVSSVRESTPVKDSPKPSKKKLSTSLTAEDNNPKTPVTGSSNRSSNSFSVIFETPKSNANTSVSSNKSSKSSKPASIKKEEAPTDRKSSVHESLINSILKSVQKKK